MKVLFADSKFWESNLEFKKSYETIIKKSYKNAKKLLPSLESDLTFVCQTNSWECIPETGEGANTRSSKLILLSINPELPIGIDILLENSESAILHECNHAARFALNIGHASFLESSIMEGLATVFERKYSGSREPLWGKYDTEVISDWYEEIKKLKSSYRWGDYMYNHPDGRRWIGYKVGTWIIDQAMKKSNKTVIELTKLDNKEILKLAELI